MEVFDEKQLKKRICAGILAHVDAGKTTLSEALLYLSGTIRKLGRVDNQDAFLDTYQLERARGITIFPSRQSFGGMIRQLHFWIRRGMWIFRRRWSGRFRYWIMLSWSSAVLTGSRAIQKSCGVSWLDMKSLFSCLSTKWISREQTAVI